MTEHSLPCDDFGDRLDYYYPDAWIGDDWEHSLATYGGVADKYLDYQVDV